MEEYPNYSPRAYAVSQRTQFRPKPEDRVANPVMTFDELVTGNPFPPRSQEERIKRAELNKLLFLGKHEKVYETWSSSVTDDPEKERRLFYIVANVPGMITKLAADLEFGEFGTNMGIECENDETQEAVEEICNRSNLRRVIYEAAGIGASYRGDAILRVSLDESGLAYIDSIPSQFWFPVVSPFNVKDIKKHIVAWVIQKDNQQYLHKEIYEKGKISYEAYRIDGSTIGKKLDSMSKLYPDWNIKDDVETFNPQVFSLFHIPNYSLDDELFGIDDYMDLDTVFPAINTLLTRTDMILDKHSDPGMCGPASAVDDTENGLTLRVAGKYIPVEAGENNPEYLVWDGKLEAGKDFLNRLVDFMMYVSETSPAAFGLEGVATSVPDTGIALRTKLMRTLAKVNRKLLYGEPEIQRALHVAQLLEVSRGKTYAVEVPIIHRRDGLPEDEGEIITQMGQRGAGQTISLADAIQKIDKCSKTQAKQKADAILKEQEAKANLIVNKTPPIPEPINPKDPNKSDPINKDKK